MPNLNHLFKAEIVRLSRKEIKAAVQPLRKIAIEQRSAIAALRKQIAELQKRLRAGERTRRAPVEADTPGRAIRFSSKRLAVHRDKLGLSAAQYGKLVGVTAQTIYNWERGQRPRPSQLQALAAVRPLGKREVAAKLG